MITRDIHNRFNLILINLCKSKIFRKKYESYYPIFEEIINKHRDNLIGIFSNSHQNSMITFFAINRCFEFIELDIITNGGVDITNTSSKRTLKNILQRHKNRFIDEIKISEN